jgi:hypothetical protein
MFSAAGCDPVIEIDTDHSPWLTATDEVVAALDRIASGVPAAAGDRRMAIHCGGPAVNHQTSPRPPRRGRVARATGR